MYRYHLLKEGYLSPTPAGAYYAVSGTTSDPARRLLFSLMTQEENPQLGTARLRDWIAAENDEMALEFLYRMQSLGWVQVTENPDRAPEGALEEALPERLATLSSSNKALLADQQGFHLVSHGLTHETVEELSALSADIISLTLRHRGLLQHNLGLRSAAWAVVDAGGNSEIGFWPLYIGDQGFCLALADLPHFNQPAFTELVWALSRRYANQYNP